MPLLSMGSCLGDVSWLVCDTPSRLGESQLQRQGQVYGDVKGQVCLFDLARCGVLAYSQKFIMISFEAPLGLPEELPPIRVSPIRVRVRLPDELPPIEL